MARAHTGRHRVGVTVNFFKRFTLEISRDHGGGECITGTNCTCHIDLRRNRETHLTGCHHQGTVGTLGEGNYSFPSLVDGDWIYGISDESLIESITRGRKYAMPGWSI